MPAAPTRRACTQAVVIVVVIVAAWAIGKSMPPSDALATVVDTAVDTLTGAAGGDWFVVDLTYEIVDYPQITINTY